MAAAAAAAAAASKSFDNNDENGGDENWDDVDSDAEDRPHLFPLWRQRVVLDVYQLRNVQIVIALLIVSNFFVSLVSKQLEQPLNESQEGVFSIFEWIFNVAFTIELIANMYGNFFWFFWTGPNQWWNIFDFVIVLISLMAQHMENLPGISVLRLFRAFRVFRLFKRVESLRLIIEGVVASLPGVMNAFVVLFIFMGIWAIMGVEFFRDVMPDEFGNFLKAMFTMFEMLTMDSWNSYTTYSLVFVHKYNLAAFWAISFLFMTSIVLMSVVVAILLEKYLGCMQASEKKKARRLAREKRKQQRASQQKVDDNPRPVDEAKPARKKLWKQDEIRTWYESMSIQLFVAALILINFISGAVNAFMLPGDDGSDYSSWINVFYGLEVFFAGAFGIELVVNMYANYFSEFWVGANASWNQFDFIIVMVSILALALEGVPGISVLRLFRAFRVMRLFKRIASLRMIIEAVLDCLPKVAQAFLVLAILMGVWCIMGVEFFYKHSPDKFGTFIKAFLTMWQVLTGDGWASDIGMARDLIYGYEKEDGTVGASMPLAALYFVTYYFVASIVLTNVVIAILLEGYLAASKNESEGVTESVDGGTDGTKKTEAFTLDQIKIRNIEVVSAALASESVRKSLTIEESKSIITALSTIEMMRSTMEKVAANGPRLAQQTSSTANIILQTFEKGSTPEKRKKKG